MTKEYFLECLADPWIFNSVAEFQPVFKTMKLLNMMEVATFFSSINKHYNLKKVILVSVMVLIFGRLQKVNLIMVCLMKQSKESLNISVMIKDS